MKHINHLLLILGLMTGLVAILPAAPVYAQTKAEANECFKLYDGKTLTAAQQGDYRRTNCDWGSGGNCQSSGASGGRTRVQCTKTPGEAPCDRGDSSCSDGSDGVKTPGTTGKEIEGCDDIDTNLIDCDTTGGNPTISLLLQLINFLAVGVGIAVVGGIIWGGMLYASSNGDSSKTKQGITTIVNSVIGLLLFIFTYALVNYLVPGGLFN